MAFDEYEYLEETVENRDAEKFGEMVNGSYQMDKSQEKERSRRPKHKTDGSDDDSDHQLKRARTEDESHREANRSSSLHHHSSSSNRERSDGERHRRSREFKDRNGDRDEWSRKDRDRDRVKERVRERGRDGDRREHERERGGEREQERFNRSQCHPEKHREGWDSETIWDRERSHDMVYKERERPRDLREHDRENRRTKEKKEEVAEPEADPERDQRTVFAYQISLKADERDVYEFFSRAGKVRDVRIIMDRNSRRSKGVGYIEFYDVMSVPVAIALSGQPLLSQPVMVKPSEAEKNLVQSTTSVATGAAALIGPYSGGVRRLYVGNLNFNIKEDQLRQVFEPFGTVELVQLPSDPETGHCKGYGFVQFARLEDAKAAQSLDGQLEIGGQVMKVSAITDQPGGQEVGANACDFDDDESGHLSLNAESRTLLMQKLNCSGETSSIAGSLSVPVVNGLALSVPPASLLGATPAVSPLVAPFGQVPVPAIAGFPTAGLSIPVFTVPPIDTVGIPSECLMLKNMFDPKIESKPDFDQDIREDVEDECSKFGNLKHIYVDKSSSGSVYLRFENTQSAIAAQRALHGRWFAGKMITAAFMVPQNYEAKFPVSR